MTGRDCNADGVRGDADLPLCEVEVETPICKAKTKVLSGKKVGIVPVLRAGLGMVEGMLKLMPSARVGHIGVYRDPQTLKPVVLQLPADIAERELIVVDPCLATGGSANAAIGFIKRARGKNIKLVNMIAAPEGIAAVQKEHPDVDIYVAAIDENSTITAISCLVWAMQATGCLEPSKGVVPIDRASDQIRSSRR